MSTLKGVFPSLTTTGRKNFIQENVKNLRRMERCSRTDKAVGDQHKFQMNNTHKKTTSKYSNVVAKVNTSIRGNVRTDCVDDLHSNGGTEITEKETVRNISTPVLGKKNSVPVKKSLNASTNKSVSERKRRQNVDVNNVSQVSKINVASDPNIVRKSGEEENGSPLTETVRYKHRSVQTLEEKHIDRLYAEGVIRYPTKDNAKYNEELNKKNESNPMDQGDAHTYTNTRPNDTKVSEIPAIDERINAAKSTNKDRNSVANKIAIQLNGGVVPPNYRKGVVPKYIKDRKEALQKEEEAKAATLQADCPEGHVLLTEAERQETLSMLKKNYQDYVNELNTMPIKTDTLRVRRRKMEIEKQLNKLEEGIKVFSRLKVYVKINA